MNKQSKLAILIDPDKAVDSLLAAYLAAFEQQAPDMLLVGGSTGGANLDGLVRTLKQATSLPVYLFPGNPGQLTPEADALLLLSLLSGNNPLYLSGLHIQAARTIQQAGLTTIPTAYLLVGNSPSAVARVSDTTPIPFEEADRICDTALAAMQMGKEAIYLEAGSGALARVPARIIKKVKAEIRRVDPTVALFVGGGIHTPDEVKQAFAAGADVVVIGTHFEQHPEEIPAFIQALSDDTND